MKKKLGAMFEQHSLMNNDTNASAQEKETRIKTYPSPKDWTKTKQEICGMFNFKRKKPSVCSV